MFRRISVPLVLFSLVSICFGCSSSYSEVEEGRTLDSKWYNLPVLRNFFGDYQSGESELSLVPGPALKELKKKGRYLTQIAACGFCHADSKAPFNNTDSLSGGREIEDEYGRVKAANITADLETGIGKWNSGDIIRALRSSIDRHGRPLSREVHQQYSWLRNQDLIAISAYLLNSEAVTHKVTRRHLGGLERNKWLLFPRHHEVRGYVAAPLEDKGTIRGNYLVNYLSRCVLCHSSKKSKLKLKLQDKSLDLSKAPVFFGEERVRPSWTKKQLLEYFRRGRRNWRDDDQESSVDCPWPFISKMTQEDRQAIVDLLTEVDVTGN